MKAFGCVGALFWPLFVLIVACAVSVLIAYKLLAVLALAWMWLDAQFNGMLGGWLALVVAVLALVFLANRRRG